MAPPWNRLIRFIGVDNQIRYGEPILPSEDADIGKLEGLTAKLIEGKSVFSEDCVVTDKVVKVQKLLGPLTRYDVPTTRCIGLNYAKHKGGRPVPPLPTLFFKGANSIAGHGDIVEIPKICQDDQADYEGELVVIIGKDAKNVPKEKALDYVLGYTAGNDVSSRKWQRDPKLAGGVPQWGFSKSFDQYAPLGPAIISSKLISDPNALVLQTRVNGQLRQDTNTTDMLFDVPTLIAFLSQGTTLEAGSIIMTGTPEGVGYAMKDPQFLKAGDEVEVFVEGIGTLKHGISYE